ncbi:MAG: small-conductance mechanosensitive channel, partial [Roseivirga sp.]
MKIKTNRLIDQAKKERRKRFFFILKLILLIVILVWGPDNFKKYTLFVGAIIYYISGVLLVSLGRILMVFFYLRRKKKETDYKDNFILGINGISSILQVVVFLTALLYFYNIETKEFFTSISIVAAAIAIISKDYISNTINGFLLMFS